MTTRSVARSATTRSPSRSRACCAAAPAARAAGDATLAEPAPSAELPRTLLARAESGGDRLELRLTSLDFAEITLPNEPPRLGTTLLCEARAEAEVTGVIRGERFSLKAPAILEMNHGSVSTRPTSSPRELRWVR